ncbi:hypothetical protein NE848_12680 [Gramella jeungdoensis]|uniref:DUF892 family protein n=1 Tax=Gramella jeungdoensis TaxID=708091 RepID=A0ABT0Z3D2_9FLAO|nr:hypothetical protein [Gramella jeungdoensis]MCM8570241.1 hypothetical protein [Gramella jeungdoensis]
MNLNKRKEKMANILDVFRTHTGERLVERTGELIKLDKQKIERALVFTLPALLSVFQKNEEFLMGGSSNLISLVEKGDLILEGDKTLKQHLSEEQLESLKRNASLLKIDEQSFQDILKIAAAFLSGVIAQMKETEKDSETVDLLRTLSGQDVKYDKVFIRTLVKNEDSPDIIDSSEEIALGRKKDDNDESILGGYSGGR